MPPPLKNEIIAVSFDHLDLYWKLREYILKEIIKLPENSESRESTSASIHCRRLVMILENYICKIENSNRNGSRYNPTALTVLSASVCMTNLMKTSKKNKKLRDDLQKQKMENYQLKSQLADLKIQIVNQNRE